MRALSKTESGAKPQELARDFSLNQDELVQLATLEVRQIMLNLLKALTDFQQGESRQPSLEKLQLLQENSSRVPRLFNELIELVHDMGKRKTVTVGDVPLQVLLDSIHQMEQEKLRGIHSLSVHVVDSPKVLISVCCQCLLKAFTKLIDVSASVSYGGLIHCYIYRKNGKQRLEIFSESFLGARTDASGYIAQESIAAIEEDVERSFDIAYAQYFLRLMGVNLAKVQQSLSVEFSQIIGDPSHFWFDLNVPEPIASTEWVEQMVRPLERQVAVLLLDPCTLLESDAVNQQEAFFWEQCNIAVTLVSTPAEAIAHLVATMRLNQAVDFIVVRCYKLSASYAAFLRVVLEHLKTQAAQACRLILAGVVEISPEAARVVGRIKTHKVVYPALPDAIVNTLAFLSDQGPVISDALPSTVTHIVKSNPNATMLHGEILLIESNEADAASLELWLNESGLKVQVCCSELVALNQVSDNEFKVVLIDMDLELAELGFIKEIRARACNGEYLCILGVTQSMDDSRWKYFLQAGLNDYFAKPIERKVLLAALAYWLAL